MCNAAHLRQLGRSGPDPFMSDLSQRLADLTPAQRKLLEQRLAAKKSQSAAPVPPPEAEPIAIVGMACRFPGAPNLEAFWRLIEERRSAATEVPAERWDPDEFYDATGETPGKMSVRWAALIDSPADFDPQFFGITPREASRMDPQQRLLLEVAWEAMENAGLPADQLAGTKTGVFVGIGGTDYSKIAVPYDDYYQRIDAHMGTGNALSIAANRLSYIFDFHGPSAAVDTACSSASLAIHFAVESLRRGESDAALAGGVNMILTPETTIAFSKARMLSPEGKCRPFDAGANGYVRGEGCGLVLLKRLADAERDGDNILAVLRATSVNQDGRTSGISAPNSQSQIQCIRAALKQAALTPDDISYVEAHGTGTPLGDPIEMQALGEIFRSADGAAPRCNVASVKANVGHMETVSGVAGLIKVVLMMQHETIAPQTHFESLNPHINLAGTRLTIPTEATAWPSGSRPRFAGVSSFGFGGTNTHLIVESGRPQRATVSSGPERPVSLLKLSAKSEAALAKQAEQLAEFLDKHPDVAAADVAFSENTGRADFNHRAALTAADKKQLQQQLTSLAAGKLPAGGKQHAIRSITRPKVAFLFTGQGLQYPGMGRGLYESHPVFREAIEACDEILSEQWDDESLVDILYPKHGAVGDPQALIHQTEFTQPALFALEYALAELWQSWNVTPDIVLGHSVGEYAAACVAGVMSLEDGLALIAERARLMQTVRRHGKMAVVFAPPEKIAPALTKFGGRVVIAVLNGPENTVVSGEADAVEALAAEMTAAGVQTKLLQVSHAFHSPLMDEMLDEFEQFAAGIEYQAPQVPLAANLTGQLMTEAPTAKYWRDHLRNAVQFAAGMARVAEAGPTAIIEIGPTASLLGMGRRCVPQSEASWLPSLRQGQDDWQTLSASVAEFYVRGGQIDWRSWDEPWPRQRLLLPNYPFERSRQWYTIDPALRRSFNGEASERATARGQSSGSPLLGTRLSTVWTNTLFEASLSARTPAFLIDHQVQGSPVTPAAAYVEQALAAAQQVFGPGQHGVANLVIQQAMFLPEGMRRRVQFSIAPESGGEATFECYSRPADGEGPNANAPWVMHANGSIVHESHQTAPLSRIDLDAVRAREQSVTPHDKFYEWMGQRGLVYGPTFRVLHDLHQTEREAAIEVRLPEPVAREATRYRLHPALGDAMLQSMSGAVPLEKDSSFSPFTYMPVGIRSVRIVRPIDDYSQTFFTYVERTSSDSSPSPERVEANVHLVNADGDVLVAMDGVQVQRLGRGASGDAAVDTSRWLYRVAWQASEPVSAGDAKAASKATGAWLILSDSRGVGTALADQLAERGQSSVVVKHGVEYTFRGSSSSNGKPARHEAGTIDPLDEEHYRRVLQEAFVGKGRHCLGVVHLWSLDIPEQNLVAARAFGTASALQLGRTLARSPLPTSPQVWFVTSGAQAIDGADTLPVAVEQSPLLGLGRVTGMELPDLKPRLVDLDPTSVAKQVAEAAVVLANEVVAESKDSEVAYRNGQRYVARLTRDAGLVASSSASSAALTVPAGKPFQLRITQPGSFDALRFVPVDREPPQAGQVELEVRATGLNFSDVLKALGLYPGIKDAIVPLGIEASGVVTAVGEGVTRFKIGDEVLGVVPYAFASHARTADYALVAKPKSVDHDEACTIPITFLTAYYGLVRLAQMQPGERLLIHAGAGGVGLAAIQIAQQLGVEIYATAGSDEKRDFLRSLGVKHVYSSRTTAFAEEILADTNREGVDVVLNSLPGDAITKSLSILRAYGRFLEIGKTDIYQNRMIGLLPFQDNLSYFAIDLDRMLRQRPDYIRTLFAEVMTFFEAGKYTPLMFTRFEAEGTIDAFRYMSQRKNIGKVVVAFEKNREPRAGGGEPEKAETAVVRKDGTYLVTGGLGALGLRVGEWLADQGAGTVALLARRAPSAKVEKQLTLIRAKGAQVLALQGDVTDAASLSKALEQIPKDAPLRGVIHAAGVLADGVMADMTLEQLDRAMLPKVAGTWNLHAATLKAPLDFFVMFSSVASVLGSPGQANYAAGNAMLDALAHARRRAGLPATAINWGPWAGSGMATEAGRGEAVKSRGMGLIPPDAGLELLGKLLTADVAQVAVMDAQWDDMLKLLGSRRPALLTDIANEVQSAGGAEAGSRVDLAFRKELDAADLESRLLLVRDYIQQELARIMGVAAETLETDRQLSTFGLDSLLALELKNNLESRLDFTLPMAKLMEGPTIASLAEATVGIIFGDSADVASTKDLLTAAGSLEKWEPLMELQAGEAGRTPLIFLPALGGDSRYYADICEQLGEAQPMYAFRPRGLDQDIPPHESMEAMVIDYAAALRELQPTGPYYLAGWSTGGIYAFALAQALESLGDEVGLVAMFGAPLPSICDDVDLDDDSRFLCDLINFANCFTGTKSRVDYHELLALPKQERFQAALAEAKRQGTVPEAAPEDYIRRLVHVGEANVRAIQTCEPRPIHAPVHLFIPTVVGGLAEVSGREWDESGDHGWGREVGQPLELHRVAGDHFTMMTGEGAAQIARQLKPLVAGQLAAKK
jgi:acyl transferase domain-containing protein/NADPH:quinone reductase-like Zn-dependent oxidoreductase/thioesterase domain-containing protein/NAD(P)-dependent dehydrogenase (short-subunit alcohol dehydrogenase family)/acyl carrier protein